MEKINSILLIVVGVITLFGGCWLVNFGVLKLAGIDISPSPVEDSEPIEDSQPIEYNFYKSFGPIDHSIPSEAGFVCKHCGEKLYRQHGGTWVHDTFEDGGFTNCKDHEDKKANQKNWGKYPSAEPAETL